MNKGFLISDESTDVNFLSRLKKKIFFVASVILKTFIAVFLTFVVVIGARILYKFYYNPEAIAFWTAAERARENYRRDGNVVIYKSQ